VRPARRGRRPSLEPSRHSAPPALSRFRIVPATSGGLDSLLEPTGPIKVAQELAARAFGAKRTFWVTNGTSTANKIVVQALIQPGDIVLLDRVLAHYGPPTKEARSLLQRSVVVAIERFWPADSHASAVIDPKASPVEILYDKIDELSPQSEAERSLKSQALTVALDLGQKRLLLFQQLGSSIPVPFLVVLVFWLCIIFASFGLFAPRNGTVIAVLFVCALSVSGAVFLILELDRSFEGLLQVSSVPLRAALAQLGR